MPPAPGILGHQALATLEDGLRRACTSTALDWLASARHKLAAGDPSPLATAFPGLTRRFGRDPLHEPTDADRFLRDPHCTLDLAAYRRADVAGALLALAAIANGAEATFLRKRFDEGDMDERTTVLRTLALVDDAAVVVDLMREAQRSNVVDHFEAACCDSDVAKRVLDDADFNRMVLKMAFLDLPHWRMLEGVSRANAELSRMLQDFATEREAAGRPVWLGTLPFIARAPVAGTRARIVGHLEHGDDRQRLAAVRALEALADRNLVRFARERIGREPRAEIARALQAAVAALEEV